jgi:putative ABC transport system permease protein
MAIPISYNIRNLVQRKTTTMMTALGIALTVAVLLAVLALVEGLRTSLTATGNPQQVLVMRVGATSELVSVMTRDGFEILSNMPGVAVDEDGNPMASLEMVTIITLETNDGEEGNINARGLLPAGIKMRDLELQEGRWFEPGKREVVVGKALAGKYPQARIGETMEFGRGPWTVVGIMDAGRSAANNEIFCDVNQISADQDRSGGLSSVLLRARDEAGVRALINEIEADRRMNVTALTEREYYAQQQSSAAPILAMGTFIAIIMAIGSCFAAINTMYAAVARRSAEIGTLRVLGYSRLSILTSFTLEALLLSLLGGLLGILLVLPLTAVRTELMSFTTFSEMSFSFTVTPMVVAVGVLFSLIIGLSGLLPAASAARKEILNALRQA